MKLVDITGQQFGRLTVIEYKGKSNWLCRCANDGNEIIVLGNNLKSGRTQSCGCLQKEKAGTGGITHGLSWRPEYRIWDGIIERCTNPKSSSWSNYGGRGIMICERWRKFTNFFDDMGPRPDSSYSIDRIDNEKGYEKSNCQWRKKKDQANNTRANRILTFNGKSQTMAQWADELGIPVTAIEPRINRMGWSIERALTTPSRTMRTRISSIEIDGISLSIDGWCKKIGIPKWKAYDMARPSRWTKKQECATIEEAIRELYRRFKSGEAC